MLCAIIFWYKYSASGDGLFLFDDSIVSYDFEADYTEVKGVSFKA